MFIIVMGVSGSGKTSISRMLAQRLGWPFYDGDAFHPAANIAKMTADVPLTDEDRACWLDALTIFMEEKTLAGENGVIACSALKKAYRDVLRRYDRKQIHFVYLKGSYEVILERMKSRGDHFMKPEMLQSQFAALEEPWGILTIDVTLSKDEIVQKIVEQLMETKYSLGILGLGVMGAAWRRISLRNGVPADWLRCGPAPSGGFNVKSPQLAGRAGSSATPPRISS